MAKASCFASGDGIFPPRHKIRPLDIGLLAEVGADQFPVYDCPSAAVIPTGNELVKASQIPGPGQIRNSNGPMLVQLLESIGCSVNYPGIARDDESDLRAKIERGLQNDLLVLSGGVSAGTMDLVPKILNESGVEQVFHKVRVKPGKPIWFGIRRREDRPTYVFGLPGNPVSSLVGLHLFVRAAIERMTGKQQCRPVTLAAILTKSHVARGDRPTWWPGRWVNQDPESVRRTVEPLDWHGSSDLRALGRADCLVFFPAEIETFPQGSEVFVSSLPGA